MAWFSGFLVAVIAILFGTASFVKLPALAGRDGSFHAAEAIISVDSATRHQTITGWEAASYIGEPSDPRWSSLSRYRDSLLDSAINDIGINRIRLEVKAGVENPRDYYAEYLSSQIDYATWRCVRYSTSNDDADPNHITWAGFHFTDLDWQVENIVLPMKRRMEARGENLFVNLTYVAFTSQIRAAGCVPGLAYIHNQSAEYAEFMLAVTLHLSDRYGLTPDSWEIILEPDNVDEWRNGTVIGNAVKATAARLETAGFTPRFVVPATTSMATAPIYFDQMAGVLGDSSVRKYIYEIAYHRYTGVNDTDLQRIASRSVQYGIGASMLEWWDPNNSYQTLHKDLTMGRNSAWQQGTILGVLEVDASDPNNPKIVIPPQTRFNRQYFRFVRPGAVRIGASTSNGAFDPLAFVNPDGGAVVVVKAASSGGFTIQGIPAGTYGIKFSTPSQYDVGLLDVSIGQGQALEATIPATGVITVYQKAGSFAPAPAPSTAASPSPSFMLGFATLASLIPGVVGLPVEEEHYGVNGDSLQQTTTGLMVWRKADNWTAFTNGSRTWVNGPFGVMERSNEERFDWEASDGNQPGHQGPGPFPMPGSSPDDASRSTRSGYPRVNVRPGADWAKAAIFWFGRATEHDNYVDSRVYYDDHALYVYLAVTDYYLWADQSGSGDPRQFDAAALFLDTGAASEGPHQFVSGFRSYPVENDVRWHRQARLKPAGWDFNSASSPDWKDLIGLRYYNSGPNNNSDRDGGWTTTFTIPWAAIGRTAPPPAGTSWGMAVKVYDRDEPAQAGGTAETHWPRAFSEANPASWGSLVFDPARLVPSGPVAGTTVIRRGLDNARVQDAYAGGGGNCQGGVFGDGDRPHPTSELFVQNQSDIADFPCFSKSFLNFDLGGIPAGKRIVSATLTLHSFGGSDPGQAKPSQIQLLTLDDEWEEAALTWNNAPMARENVSVATVDVLKSFPGWPGVPFSWDATQVVAEAYASGKAANIALYSTDSAYHSGKYFVSSDTGDWNAVARPTLTVNWAD